MGTGHTLLQVCLLLANPELQGTETRKPGSLPELVFYFPAALETGRLTAPGLLFLVPMPGFWSFLYFPLHPLLFLPPSVAFLAFPR